MKDVIVDPGYLRQLASRQDNAAMEINEATGDTTFMEPIKMTHGLYVRQGVNAIDDAAQARKRAGQAMKDFSSAMAEQLRKAAVRYTATDEQQGDALDKHMAD